MTTLLVTGSRHLTTSCHSQFIQDVLGRAHMQYNFTTLVHGDCRGLDDIADRWGRAYKLKVTPYPADWYKNGRLDKTAGPRRNIEMLEAHPGAIVYAFPTKDSKGTRQCIREALNRGHVVVVTEM